MLVWVTGTVQVDVPLVVVMLITGHVVVIYVVVRVVGKDGGGGGSVCGGGVGLGQPVLQVITEVAVIVLV